MSKTTKGIQIHGKTYMTVAERVNDFRNKYGDDYGIITEIIQDGEVVQMLARIENADQRTIATGFAEERRGSTQINKTSALENCETSAIGRALANLGFGGTEYASANEVENAIHQQMAGDQRGEQSQEGAVSPPADQMPDAEWAKLVQLTEAAKANVPAMLKHLKITLPDDNLKLLNQQQYGRVVEALNDKLSKMAKEETNAKAKEDA